ncbi:desulfoferrodoxin [Clostridiaceae bacterium OttesenSCG-928-D20]|nr:desulfoferrodoxin [Clostridiaceae bacterium OttesenSCG-928-D20]
MNIYKCEICGTMVEEIKFGAAHPFCCGQAMTKLEPGVTDGAHEKHVPVFSIEDNTVTVTIGEVEHPMLAEHYIEWIAVETTEGVHRKSLSPGDKPRKTFALSKGEEVKAVYEYCNLHGLWKA